MPAWSDPQAWPWWRPTTPQYPDTSVFEAGDLLLFTYPGDDTSEQIARGQAKLGYSPHAAAFTHAAIYIGSACILCEAVEPQVRLHLVPGLVVPPLPAGQLSDRPTMLVRRVPRKTREQRAQIAAQALRSLDTRYGLEDLKAVVAAIRRRNPIPDTIGAGLICSMLFTRSWSRALPGGRLPRHWSSELSRDPIVPPAELAQTDLLDSIPFVSLQPS